jgi:hypothetical protein
MKNSGMRVSVYEMYGCCAWRWAVLMLEGSQGGCCSNRWCCPSAFPNANGVSANTQPTRPKRDAREWSGIIEGELGAAGEESCMDLLFGIRVICEQTAWDVLVEAQ